MYDVFFYMDAAGREPVLEYIEELAAKTDKGSRIKLHKIRDYIKYLRAEGKRAGEPYVKHIEGEIWELRPMRDRVLFAAWDGRSFILLHHFTKKTRKTPRCEIERANRNLIDYTYRKEQTK